MWRAHPGRAAVLDKVVPGAVPRKMTFVQRLPGGKRASHTAIWGRSMLGGGDSDANVSKRE